MFWADSQEDVSLSSILRKLSSKLTQSTIKLTVDEDDVVTDAIAFYKRSTFDASRPMMVRYSGQPAIDTGGVLRQFFSDVFQGIITSMDYRLFEGPPARLLFGYNQQLLAAGLPKLLGTMIAHSICQNGPGFPYLAPSMYYYVATGDTAKAEIYATVQDITDDEVLQYISKVPVVYFYLH